MANPNDIQGRFNVIQDWLAEDKIANALKEIMDIARDFSVEKEWVHEATIYNGNHRNLETTYKRGDIEYGEFFKRRSSLLFMALELLDKIVDSLSNQLQAA